MRAARKIVAAAFVVMALAVLAAAPLFAQAADGDTESSSSEGSGLGTRTDEGVDIRSGAGVGSRDNADYGDADGEYYNDGAYLDDPAFFVDDVDEFDALFEDAADVGEPVVTEAVTAGTDYNVQLGTLSLPIQVEGKLSAELGGGYVHDAVSDATFYFDFKNYLYFTTRPDKYLALKGVLKTTMPKDTSDSEAEQRSHLLYLYEIYFDYLMFNRIYITAGKKQTVWGNIRLFSNYYDENTGATSDTDGAEGKDDNDNIRDARYTNILYDSRSYISGSLRVPFGNNTFTMLAMYNDELENVSTRTEAMSLAANAEFVIFGTSFSLFGRRFRLSEPETDDAEDMTQLPILGVEVKRSLFGFDLYGQSMARVRDGSALLSIITSGFRDRSSIDRIISTVGTYRLWTSRSPYVGFCAEFQNIYRPEQGSDETRFTNRFALEIGMARLGPNRNIRPAVQWNHNITDWSGFVKAGVVVARVLPHCDWQTGVKYEYGLQYEDYRSKLTVGTYLTISLDY